MDAAIEQDPFLLFILEYIYNQGPSTASEILVDARMSQFPEATWEQVQDALWKLFSSDLIEKTEYHIPPGKTLVTYKTSGVLRPQFSSRRRTIKKTLREALLR